MTIWTRELKKLCKLTQSSQMNLAHKKNSRTDWVRMSKHWDKKSRLLKKTKLIKTSSTKKYSILKTWLQRWTLVKKLKLEHLLQRKKALKLLKLILIDGTKQPQRLINSIKNLTIWQRKWKNFQQSKID